MVIGYRLTRSRSTSMPSRPVTLRYDELTSNGNPASPGLQAHQVGRQEPTTTKLSRSQLLGIVPVAGDSMNNKGCRPPGSPEGENLKEIVTNITPNRMSLATDSIFTTALQSNSDLMEALGYVAPTLTDKGKPARLWNRQYPAGRRLTTFLFQLRHCHL